MPVGTAGVVGVLVALRPGIDSPQFRISTNDREDEDGCAHAHGGESGGDTCEVPVHGPARQPQINRATPSACPAPPGWADCGAVFAAWRIFLLKNAAEWCFMGV